MGSLTVEEPCYGTSVTAIERTFEEQPKYIRITDFDDYGIDDSHEYMTADAYAEKHLLKINDILFARTGGTVGKTYFYDGSIGKAVFAGYCIRFRFDEKRVLPKFVYWCTKTKQYIDWVKGIQRPSGQPNINKEEFKSFEIPLSNLERQQELVDIIDIAFKMREEKLKQADNLLSSMSSYILSALNIKLGDYKDRLCVAVKLGTIKNDLTFSAQYYNPERLSAIKSLKGNHSIAVKKLCEIVDFRRDIVESCESSKKYLGLAGVESYTGELSGIEEAVSGQAFAYKNGDILYGRLRPYLNKVLLAENDGICSTEFHVMQVLNRTEIFPEYLAAIMRSDLILSQTKYMMTGNTHPRISNNDVKNLFIPIPHYELQCKIVAELRNRRNTARLLKQTAEQEWKEAKAQFESIILSNKDRF